MVCTSAGAPGAAYQGAGARDGLQAARSRRCGAVARGRDRSADYQRNTGQRSRQAVQDERLLVRIRALHAASYYAYGVSVTEVTADIGVARQSVPRWCPVQPPDDVTPELPVTAGGIGGARPLVGRVRGGEGRGAFG